MGPRARGGAATDPETLIAGARVLRPPGAPAVDAARACEAALDAPVSSEPLENLARRGDRVAILVPDDTRETPRAAQVGAVLGRLRGAGVASADIVVVVATGAHARTSVPLGGWGAEPHGLPVVIHDGGSRALRRVGKMKAVRRRFVPAFSEAEAERSAARVPGALLRSRAAAIAGRARTLFVAPAVADASLVVGLGAICPHSIAGFAGGAKMIFPGVADARSIRENHALRLHPSVRRGVLDGNLAREHFETGARLLRARRFSLDVLLRPGGGVTGAVAGDPDAAVRAGAAALRPALEVGVETADVVVSIVDGPAARTAYQATKGAAAGAPFVRAGGSVAILAACEGGIGDVRGARRIVALGLRTTLPPGVRIVLVSPLAAGELRSIGLEAAPDVASLVNGNASSIVLSNAMHVLAAPLPAPPASV